MRILRGLGSRLRGWGERAFCLFDFLFLGEMGMGINYDEVESCGCKMVTATLGEVGLWEWVEYWGYFCYRVGDVHLCRKQKDFLSLPVSVMNLFE
jgi:hypothetical protein